MPKKTKVFTPENMKIIADLRAKKVPAVQIAKILGVSLSALARNVAKHDLPRQKKKTKAKPFVVAQYVHHTGTAPISLEEMAARPKAQTITERRAVAYVPPKAADIPLSDDMVMASDARTLRTDPVTGNRIVSFVPTPRHVVEEAKRGRMEEQRWKHPRLRDRTDNPFRLKARVSEFNRDRRAILEDIEGEIDKAFRKFRTLAGPNTRIQDDEVFSLLSAEAKAALDHLQAQIDAARILRDANGVIIEAAICLHNAGAAATRATA